jgi:hypothetical protein
MGGAAGANAALIAIQTGVLVFLFPLYLADRRHIGPGSRSAGFAR